MWRPRLVNFLRRRGGRVSLGHEFDALLQQALFANLAHDHETTERALTEAVRIDSDAIDAYVALCRFYRGRGEIGRAIRLHQNLLLRKDLSPSDRQEVLLELAQDFHAGGFLRRAVASFEEVLAHAPRNPVAARALVELHADLQDFPRAIALEKRLARFEKRGKGREAALWVRFGEHERDHGRANAARKAAKTAMRRDGRCAPAFLLLGQLEADRGRDKAALAAWSKIPALDRRLAVEVYPRVEATFAATDKARDYEGYLRALIEEEPGDVGATLALARYLNSRGDADLALIELKRLLDRQPRNLEARVVLGRCLLAAGRDDEIGTAYAGLLDLLEEGTGPSLEDSE
ncbi:MAG: tetratricopeptide repeat protein [bacterium]|nr:tetratricopeptide repeat protein [bacterium]MCP5039653.1 tetratricopeptide repeat protein [bacterium]